GQLYYRSRLRRNRRYLFVVEPLIRYFYLRGCTKQYERLVEWDKDEEDPKEDLEMKEEEGEEMEIEDEMNDPEIINPYEIEEGELPPLPADSDTSFDSEPEVEAEDEDENESAIVGTITREPYHSVSALDDQMRGLMLEDKEEKERLKKKLKASQKEKEQMEQAFRHVVDWIRKHFGVEIPPCMDDGDVAEAIVADGAERNAMGGLGNNANGARGQGGAPSGRALTWWNSQVATLGLEVINGKSWGDMKKIMMEEFCPDEEVQRLEDELRNLKLRDINIAAYPQRFNELVLICLEVVSNEKKKIEAYIRGLLENIKGEVTSSRPANLNGTV
nr:hypothetical protein [Tanacetum cinerariifolium]